MEKNIDTLELIYVHKIGENYKGELLYEFLFSQNSDEIDPEEWGWYDIPASECAEPPNIRYVDQVLNLKTKDFELECLHESHERCYYDGYHKIQALAYETESEDEEDDGYINANLDYSAEENSKRLVFLYGMTYGDVSDMLYSRDVPNKTNEFASTKLLPIK